MHEALTGELPITSHSRRELLDLHQRQIPTPMRLKRPDLPIPEALDMWGSRPAEGFGKIGRIEMREGA